MANFNTSDSQLLTNMLQEALFTQSEKSIADKVFKTYDMTGTPGLTAQIPVYPEIAAQERNETTDVTDTAFSVASTDVTAAEVQARVDVSDLLNEGTVRNTASDVGQLIGGSIGEQVDTNAFALFKEDTIRADGGTMVGTTGTAVTPTIILEAIYNLRNVNAPTDAQGDYHCVLAPGQAYDIARLLTTAGFSTSANAMSNVGNELLSSSAYVGKIYNCKVFSSNAIDADSVATDINGCVFSPSAFAHVIKRPLRIESQRDASMRHTEYVGSTAVKSALIKGTYAVVVKGKKNF